MLLVWPACAQTPAPPDQASDPAPPAQPAPSVQHLPAAQPVPGERVGVRFITDQTVGEFRASKYVGLSVYGADNQKVGDINEILIDAAGAAQAVVIGVGGFLGIGEKSVAVPFSSLEWVNTRPQIMGASGTGVIGSAVTAVTSVANNVRSATAEVTAPNPRSPAETAAFNGYPDHAILRISKVELQGAPTFRYYSETHAPTPAGSGAAGGTAAPRR